MRTSPPKTVNTMKQSIAKAVRKLGIPTIKVKVNGEYFWFLVDSGSTANFITQKTYDKIASAAEKAGDCVALGFEGKAVERPVFNVQYRIGRHDFTQEFGVMKCDHFNRVEKECGIKIDGLVGAPFMILHNIRIDYRSMTVEYGFKS